MAACNLESGGVTRVFVAESDITSTYNHTDGTTTYTINYNA